MQESARAALKPSARAPSTSASTSRRSRIRTFTSTCPPGLFEGWPVGRRHHRNRHRLGTPQPDRASRRGDDRRNHAKRPRAAVGGIRERHWPPSGSASDLHPAVTESARPCRVAGGVKEAMQFVPARNAGRCAGCRAVEAGRLGVNHRLVFYISGHGFGHAARDIGSSAHSRCEQPSDRRAHRRARLVSAQSLFTCPSRACLALWTPAWYNQTASRSMKMPALAVPRLSTRTSPAHVEP